MPPRRRARARTASQSLRNRALPRGVTGISAVLMLADSLLDRLAACRTDIVRAIAATEHVDEDEHAVSIAALFVASILAALWSCSEAAILVLRGPAPRLILHGAIPAIRAGRLRMRIPEIQRVCVTCDLSQPPPRDVCEAAGPGDPELCAGNADPLRAGAREARLPRPSPDHRRRAPGSGGGVVGLRCNPPGRLRVARTVQPIAIN